MRRGARVLDLADPETRAQCLDYEVTLGIAIQIRALRHAKGWTQRELAGRMGMSVDTVSRLECNAAEHCSVSTLRRVAHAFDVALIIRFVSWEEWLIWEGGILRRDIPQSFAEESAIWDSQPIGAGQK